MESTEYMELSHIRQMTSEIRASFEELLSSPIVSKKPNAKQWKFFRECFKRTVDGISPDNDYSHIQLAQYKYEVQTRLKRYYATGGTSVDFVFALFHKRDIKTHSFPLEESYPNLNGYYLLIRDRRLEPKDNYSDIYQLKDYLVKVVSSCIDAEFEAYQNLPNLNMENLEKYFLKDGSALKGIKDILVNHASKGKVISNKGNPSTKRIVAISVSEINRDTAIVKTTEYWFLRWWSAVVKKYIYPYRETNHQVYYLKRVDREWFVEDNLRPNPKSSAHMRQRPKRKPHR